MCGGDLDISTPEDIATYSSDLLSASEHLAALMEASGFYKESEKLSRRIVRIAEMVHGLNHLETLRAKYWLGRSLYRCGKFDQAEVLLRLTSDQAILLAGINHPVSRDCLIWLAHSLDELGRLKDAQALFQQQLTLDELYYRQDDNAMLQVLAELGTSYLLEGKNDLFEEIYIKVLELSTGRPNLEEGRFSVLHANIANLLKRKGELDPL